MSDLKKYIAERKKRDKHFAEGYDQGYEQFKVGVLLRQGATEMREWYEELREKYRPHTIKILLIAESPPDPGDGERRFFYSEVLTYDNLYRGVAQAVYGEQVALEDKPIILRRLQEEGFWLIDACERPINKLKSGMRDALIRKSIPELIQKCRKLAPSKGVIICHGRVYKLASSPLRDAGITVLHKEQIPFPLGNFRDQFIQAFRKALKAAKRGE